MRRRYAECDQRPRGSNWFIIFFLLLAIFFFNYLGKKLGGGIKRPIPCSLIVIGRDGNPEVLDTIKGKFVILSFVSTNCYVCRKQIEELKKLEDKDWIYPVVVYVDRHFDKEKDSYLPGATFALHPKEVARIVEVWGVERVPTTFIIDKRGFVRRKIEGLTTEKDLISYVKVIKRYGI